MSDYRAGKFSDILTVTHLSTCGPQCKAIICFKANILLIRLTNKAADFKPPPARHKPCEMHDTAVGHFQDTTSPGTIVFVRQMPASVRHRSPIPVIQHVHVCCAVDQDSAEWQVFHCCRSLVWNVLPASLHVVDHYTHFECTSV